MRVVTTQDVIKRLNRAILIDIRRPNEVAGGVIQSAKWMHIPQTDPFSPAQVAHALTLGGS